MAMKSHETFTLIEEITRLDGTKYLEISNMVQNGRAELAAERKMIKQVRILQLNIPHSVHVINYENYINQNYEMPTENFDHFEEWKRTPEMDQEVQMILKENHIGQQVNFCELNRWFLLSPKGKYGIISVDNIWRRQ